MKVVWACLAAAVAAAGQTTVTTKPVNLSALAKGVVVQTRQARHALAYGDKTATLDHVNCAASMARDIISAPQCRPGHGRQTVRPHLHRTRN